MIHEPNVPKSVRNWAVCQVRIRDAEYDMAQLAAGRPLDFRQFHSLKALGREKFTALVVEPELRRLERLRRRCRILARALEADGDPRRYLLAKREMLGLVGNTLHCVWRRRELFLTPDHCSLDGERIFNREFEPRKRLNREGFAALDLLSLGFGRAQS